MSEYTPRHKDSSKTDNVISGAKAAPASVEEGAPVKHKNGNSLYIVMVAVFVLIAIMGAMFVTGVIPGFGSSSGSTGDPAPFKGKWSIDGVTFYSCDGVSKGTMTTAISEYDFKYDVSDTHVYIDYYDDSCEDSSFLYSFKGSTLTLTRWGVDYVMTKAG